MKGVTVIMHALKMNTLFLLFLIVSLSGCATLRTVPHYTKDSPKLYSGTRMDFDALSRDSNYIHGKYHAEAPSKPALDLPFSFMLDTLVLFPVAIPIATSVALLE